MSAILHHRTNAIQFITDYTVFVLLVLRHNRTGRRSRRTFSASCVLQLSHVNGIAYTNRARVLARLWQCGHSARSQSVRRSETISQCPHFTRTRIQTVDSDQDPDTDLDPDRIRTPTLTLTLTSTSTFT